MDDERAASELERVKSVKRAYKRAWEDLERAIDDFEDNYDDHALLAARDAVRARLEGADGDRGATCCESHPAW